MIFQGLNERLFWAINGASFPLGDYLMYLFTLSGETASAAALGLAAMHFYRGLSRNNVILFAAALLAGGVAVHVIKQNLAMDRPLAHFAAQDPALANKVRVPFERLYHRTFPSGHTQTAFSVAVLFALLFKRHRGYWLAWACVTGVSRIYLGVHFPADVLAGAAAGAATAAGTYYFFLSKGWVTPPRPRSVWFPWA